MQQARPKTTTQGNSINKVLPPKPHSEQASNILQQQPQQNQQQQQQQQQQHKDHNNNDDNNKQGDDNGQVAATANNTQHTTDIERPNKHTNRGAHTKQQTNKQPTKKR